MEEMRDSGALRIREAVPADEPALRALTEVPMPGAFQVSYRQAPDFFLGERIRGDEARTGVLTDATNAVLGCGTRVVRRAWFDGAWRRTGYYCTLRAFKSGHNARAVLVAYRWARGVEAADPLAVITSTIVSANVHAIKLLTSRRAGLPAYLDAGGIVTFSAVARALRNPLPPSLVLARATSADAMALRAFYNDPDEMQPLFPALADPLPPGLDWSDFVLVREKGTGAIVAAAALWDQSAHRQVHVVDYSTGLRLLRPLVNLASAVQGLPRLPAPGNDFAFRYLAFRKVRAGDAAAFRALLAGAGAALRPNESLSFSLHERDPFFPLVADLKAIRYASRLYTLSYAPDPRPVDFGGAPYIEAAML